MAGLDWLIGTGSPSANTSSAMNAGVLSQIGSIVDKLGVFRPKMNYGPTPSEQQAMALLLAMQDPNNSLVKANTQANLQRGMENFLMQLKQRQMLDQRALARGNRQTFFAPERADETIDYLTSRGIGAQSEIARQTALQGMSDQIRALQGMVPAEMARRDAMNTDRMSRYETFQTGGGFGGAMGGLSDFIKAVFGDSKPSVTYGETFGPYTPMQMKQRGMR